MKKILIVGVGVYTHTKFISSEPPNIISNGTTTERVAFDISKLDMPFIPNNKIRSKYKRNLKYK